MSILYLIIFFILGSLMGSFYTVLGLRIPKKEDFITTQSHCDSCGHVLKLYEMIPVISYLIQKGKCRHCHKKIDLLSTYIEIFTATLFAVSYHLFGFSYELLIALGIVSILMIVVVSDITYLIIPDEILIFFSIYFVIIQILNLGIKGAIINVISGVFLFSILYIIMLIGNKVLKKECLGGGDIKMMFIFGLILDPLLGIFSIFLASIIALPISLLLLYKQNERVIPFGPFLLIGLALIYFTGITSDMILNFILLK